MCETDKPLFLKSFPEEKIKLTEWTKFNRRNLNCETNGVKQVR